MLTNLLPPKNKAELFEEEIKNLIIILGTLFLIFLFSLSLILFGVQNYISGRVDLEKMTVDFEKKRIEDSEIQNLRAKIISLNQSLSQLNSFYQEQKKLAEVLNKISEILPPQMYLTNFSYQKELNQVSLSGFSPTQEILNDFRKDLEKKFSDVHFPPQNWVELTDIDFQATFKITK
jgi:Tfp pilus assembly protein PilN